MPVRKLTKSAIDKLPYAEKGQKLYLDTDLKGFGLLVGKKTKTYFAQRDMAGRTKRVTIGRHGTWTTSQARREARDLISRMDRGEDPNATARADAARSISLEKAAALHREQLKRKKASPLTFRDFDHAMENYFADWKKRPLAEITRTDVRKRHSRISKKTPYAANRAIRIFRAIYNTALKEHEDLPTNPAIAVMWNKEERRQEPVSFDDLPDWHEKVQALPNSIRRDYQLFVLFTGLRRRDAAGVREGIPGEEGL